MLTKLRLSLTKQIEDIEKSTFGIALLYTTIGYVTVAIIVMIVQLCKQDSIDSYKLFTSIVALCFLIFFYYTRYRMIVDDKDDHQI